MRGSRIAWLVRIEIASVALVNLSLLAFVGFAWIAFAASAVESGMFTEAPGSPFQPDHVASPDDVFVERGYTTIGYLLWAGPFTVIAGSLLFFVALLHRWVVVPFAAEVDRADGERLEAG